MAKKPKRLEGLKPGEVVELTEAELDETETPAKPGDTVEAGQLLGYTPGAGSASMDERLMDDRFMVAEAQVEPYKHPFVYFLDCPTCHCVVTIDKEAEHLAWHRQNAPRPPVHLAI